ncbi:MAG TPA: L,D-transpeptidase family protein [Chloroflexota bacterium]|nr:L,D-transpeptidase family protein [Chloroflexota bacterium]
MSGRWAVLVSALIVCCALAGCAAAAAPSTSAGAAQGGGPGGNASGAPAGASPARPSPTATATATATAIPPTPTPTAIPAPQLSPARFSLFTVNPEFTTQDVSFTVSQPARVTIEIVPAGSNQPVRTLDLGNQPAGKVQASWDGKDDAGQLVAAGGFSYIVHATGAGGATATASYHDLGITHKRMVISLSKQQLTAYDGNQQYLTTLVTTGNPALPTPTGAFPILAKYHPFTFVSPWPKGNKFYYEPSPVSFALLFDDSGYYVHDSPWRTAYGPGTNAKLGTPGLNYTGSHGCVNVPLAAETKLFSWATIGTIVQVVP